jgi:hypothetical protein
MAFADRDVRYCRVANHKHEIPQVVAQCINIGIRGGCDTTDVSRNELINFNWVSF